MIIKDHYGSRKVDRVGSKLKLIYHEKFKKTNKEESERNQWRAGTVWCPAKPIISCGTWCGLTKEQKMRCLLDVEEPCECF